jgi:hypothetical protein
MLKFLITSFLVLLVATPAMAKPKDVYPVSCDDLWAAVKDTLKNPHDYGIMSMSDFDQRAQFVVVGNLTTYLDSVALKTAGDGCAMKAAISEVGADNADWRQFHNRIARSLAKRQAAKPKPAVEATGQM